MDRDDREAIEGCARGALASLERLYRAHGDRVYSISLRLAGSRADAEDITQEVFLTVYREAHTFSAGSTVATWLYRIAVNTGLNWQRGSKRRSRREMEWGEAMRFSHPRSPGPEEIALRADAAQRIRAAVAKLPDPFRLPVLLHDIEGLSYDEVAATLGIRTGTLASRLARARSKLLALLEEENVS